MGLLMCLARCAAVPDIHFIDDALDGGANDASADADATREGGGGDASDDVVGQDTGVGCPSAPPPGADGCCDFVPCTPSTCAKCGACSGADICCARGANPVCKPTVACN